MKGVIYTRVSSDEQIKGTSLEFQEELCRKYCEQKEIQIEAVYREEGETAKSLSMNNRKKFLQALDFCKKNKNRIGAFVVFRIDRFARNTEDHFAVRKILHDCGATLHSVSEPIGNKPAEKFIETVLAGAAEYENALRKQRSIDGMAAKINQGIFPWKPPLGYKSLKTNKKGLKKTQPDPPDQQVFPLVQRALKKYAKGNCSQAELARILDKWGLKAVRGKKTRPQLIDSILGKYLKFYAGIITNPWSGEEIEGLHKPMIAKKEMYKIQMIREGKSKTLAKRDRYNPRFPLRRTVICAACGIPLTGSSPRGNGGRYHYYHCKNKECPEYGKGIKKKDLEDQFSEYFRKITPKEKFLKVLKETVLDFWGEKQLRVETEKHSYQKRLSALKRKRERIFEMREDGSYTREEFSERKQEIEKEIAETETNLSGSQTENFDADGVLAYAADFISKLDSKWQDLPPELQPRFQRLVFPDGICYDRNSGFGTARLGLIYELNRQFSGKKSSLATLKGFNWNHLITELREWQELWAEIRSYNCRRPGKTAVV